jgi:hypothetical protein
MKQNSVRATVDISVRELVLAGVKNCAPAMSAPRPKRVYFPLIVSDGQKVDLTNNQMIEHVECP